jgi:hypothetical protein
MKTLKRLAAPALIFAVTVACGFLVKEASSPTALSAALSFGLVN